MKQKMYMNRELSWLKFNERVLEEAEDESVPLCERLSFASIYQSNLDEFFMVRVGSLVDQMRLKEKMKDNKTKLTPKQQLEAVLEQVQEYNERRDNVYQQITGQLERIGVRIVNFQKLTNMEGLYVEKYFDMEVAPVISATIVGKRQPFPFLRSKEIYALAVLETKSGKEKIGIVPCGNGVFAPLVKLPTHGIYMLTDELILHFLPKVFKGYKIKAKSLLRITRNADIDADALYDEELDYREFMEEVIKRRKKLEPIRLELSRQVDKKIVKALCKYLDLSPEYVFQNRTPLDLSFVSIIRDDLRRHQELFYEKHVPQKSPDFREDVSVIEQIIQKDRMLSYPYESMKPFLELLHEAATDPNVVSIKMTLYRVSKQSKVIESLIEAAENGKEVVVLVELKARFDEENNIEWSRRLEEAGCRVIYGLGGYKVHSKLCLITRKCENGVQYITQIGTGNYNESTARLYTDLSLMTANQAIGIEAARVFAALSMGETVKETEHLLVAPNCLQNQVIALIDEEIAHATAGEEAYIGLKMNSLTDKRIIDKLCEASQAGVKIDMVIRGICCLIPGVADKTEHITVRSIVGRYLEHSRIYLFGKGERQNIYIASADFMTRNTLKRVEVAAPIYDKDLQKRLVQMFDILLRDNQKAREENAVGNYTTTKDNKEPLNAQEYFYRQAYERAIKAGETS